VSDADDEGPTGRGRGRGWRAPLHRLASLGSVPSYRFAVLFLALLTGFALGYPALRLRFGTQFAALETFTARLLYEILVRIAPDVTLQRGSIVTLGRFQVAIIDECTGVYEAVLLGSALLAFQATWRKTALGFLIGMPLIYAMNVARIAMLLFIGRDFPRAFEFMHVYFWQVTMIAMVTTVWLIWVLWVVRDGPSRQAP
jgi:archaeosortase B (VPXXXP-CTERM-specific)